MNMDDNRIKKCDYCGETVDYYALRCPYCASRLDGRNRMPPGFGHSAGAESDPKRGGPMPQSFNPIQQTQAAAWNYPGSGYPQTPADQSAAYVYPYTTGTQTQERLPDGLRADEYKMPAFAPYTMYRNKKTERAMKNWMKVAITALCSVLPIVGQLTGIVTGVVLLGSDEEDRRSFGLALLIASLVLFAGMAFLGGSVLYIAARLSRT